jgi:hypothetical protein
MEGANRLRQAMFAVLSDNLTFRASLAPSQDTGADYALRWRNPWRADGFV